MTPLLDEALGLAETRSHLTVDQVEALFSARGDALERLLAVASALRDEGIAAKGRPGVITFSKKVFLPITTLCRDRCHYCIFVDTPGKLKNKGKAPFMTADEIVKIAKDGAALGCKEALFTLGDRPEDRWEIAREWLTEHGYESTLDYIRAMGQLVLEETGMLPHFNPGVMSWAEMQRLKPYGPSMGMMLETTSRTLWSEKGQPHYASPDKDPAVRLQVLEDAGRSRIPFSTGVLLGIGETVRDRAESLVAIRESHERWGHIQEVIVQNFRAKPGTAMQNDDDFALQEYVAAVAVARIVMGADMTIQVPPNLTDVPELHLLVRAGVDDWGGVSPLTPDHVNPERAWPQITTLAGLTADAGYELRERLTAHSQYVADPAGWIDDRLLGHVEALADATTHLAHEPARPIARPLGTTRAASPSLPDLEPADLLRLRGPELDALAAYANELRREAVGDNVTFVVNRNLDLAVPLTEAQLGDLADEAWERGATEICAQGLLPAADPFAIVRTIKTRQPGIHLHAFRPAEIAGLDLARLKAAGLDSIPGTGALLLDDSTRAADWIATITAAHRAGLRSTATLVYGRGETPEQVVAHLRTLATIQRETGGFTEFIPMPYLVDGIAPQATLDETRAVIAVSRIMLHGLIDHVQVAWTKLGLRAASLLLDGGADDLGGLLDAGPLFPSAGAEAGRSLTRADVEMVAGRGIRQRTTTYGEPAVRLEIVRTQLPVLQ